MQSILRPTSPKTNLANSVPRQIEEKEKHIDKSQAQTGRTTNPFDIVSSFRQPYTTPFDPTLAGVEVTPSALLPISRAVTDATSVHRPLHSRDGTLDFTNGDSGPTTLGATSPCLRSCRGSKAGQITSLPINTNSLVWPKAIPLTTHHNSAPHPTSTRTPRYHPSRLTAMCWAWEEA